MKNNLIEEKIQAQATEIQAQATEIQAQATEIQAQATEIQAQATKIQAQATKIQALENDKQTIFLSSFCTKILEDYGFHLDFTNHFGEPATVGRVLSLIARQANQAIIHWTENWLAANIPQLTINHLVSLYDEIVEPRNFLSHPESSRLATLASINQLQPGILKNTFNIMYQKKKWP